MVRIVAFYALVVAAAGCVSWAFFSPTEFPIRPDRMLYLAGAAILLGSLVLLPWITTDPPDIRAENLAWLRSEPYPWWAVQAIIAVREKQIPNPSEAFDLKAYLCDTSEREQWYALLGNHTSLTAWRLLLRAPTFSILFAITLWGRLLLSIGTLLAGIASSPLHQRNRGKLALGSSRYATYRGAFTKGSQDVASLQTLDVIRKALGGLAILLLVLALVQIPSADTLGLRQDFELDYINLLAGVRISSGMWWSLVGLLAILIGISAEEIDGL